MWSFTIVLYVIVALSHAFPSIQAITTEGCGETMGCLREPADCQLSECTYLATYQRQGEQVTFELRGNNDAWVAIGFNDNQRMVGTNAIFCYNNNGNVLIRSGKLTARALPTLIEEKDLKLIEQSTEGGSVRCRFQHPVKPNSTTTLRNLEESLLFLIYAQGELSGSEPANHGGKARGFSGELVNITRNVDSTAKSPSDLSKRIHGSIMVVIWICLASIGLFFARYTRNVWSDVTLFQQKVWFQFHRLLMISVVLGTIAAIIVIFVDLDGFTEGEDKFKAHAIIGLVVLTLATLQPIGALFRPHPGTSKRPIFNIIHRMAGLSAFILSIVATALGLQIFDKKNAYYVVLSYAAFLVLVILTMEIVKFIFEKKEQETVGTDPMPGGMTMETSIAKTTTVHLTLSKIFLGMVLVVSLVITAAVIYIINDSSEN